MFQKQQEKDMPWLVQSNQSCILFGYVPRACGFDTETEQIRHELSKDLRPTKLIYFVLNSLQYILETV